jgi:hypothetical protein
MRSPGQSLHPHRAIRRRLSSAAAVLALGVACAAPAWAAPPVPSDGTKRGSLRGEAITPLRQEVPGAVVIALGRDGGAMGLTATEESGRLALDGLPPGIYDVLVDAEGYAPTRVENLPVEPPYRAVAEAVLRPGVERLPALDLPAEEGEDGLLIRVTDDSGKPLSRVQVEMVPVGHRANPLIGRTGEQGALRLDASAGSWRLTVRRAGWTPIVVPRLSWPGGELTVLSRMVPLPGDARVPISEILP